MSKNYKANITMIGDFNQHLQSMTKYLEAIRFKAALRSDIATHSQENQIDQVFSNQPIVFSKCEEPPFPTDHLVISVTIFIKISKDSHQ